MAVPYTFGTATAAIPLSQLDTNFATAITLGNTAVYLGNTTTSIGNLTLTNVTISSGSVTITDTTVSGNVTLSGGTANGIAYLNGSKVLTTGSALSFNGTNALTQTANSSEIYLAGGSSAAQGGYVSISRGGTPKVIIGTASNVIGGGSNTSDDLALFATAESRFFASSTEQMRLTSTGLGIGTSSPGARLGVLSADGATTSIVAGATGKLRTFGYADATRGALLDSINTAENTYLPLTLNGSSLLLQTGAVTRATLDSSGNLGLGVTPSAWGSVWKATQIQVGAFIASQTNANDIIHIGTNAFGNSSNAWTYINTAASTRYQQYLGAHSWYTAASGTAGNAITFTQAATLTAAGDYLVGKTAVSDTTVGFQTTSGGRVACGMASGDGYVLYSTSASAYRFYVTNAGQINATSITISAISDQRLKENVCNLETGLNAIMALKPRRFDWKEGKGQNKKNVAGFIADEFETVFPECVGVSKAGGDGIEYKNINHETLIPTLVKAMQEQQAIIESLTTRLTALEGKA